MITKSGEGVVRIIITNPRREFKEGEPIIGLCHRCFEQGRCGPRQAWKSIILIKIASNRKVSIRDHPVDTPRGGGLAKKLQGRQGLRCAGESEVDLVLKKFSSEHDFALCLHRIGEVLIGYRIAGFGKEHIEEDQFGST